MFFPPIFRHIQIVHEKIKPIQCEKCGQGFSLLHNYKQHLRFVHLKEIEVCTCGICLKQFNHKSNLSQHISKVHLNIRRHSCQKCYKKFSSRSDLMKHTNVHSETQVCEKCGKGFKGLKKFTSHQQKGCLKSRKK